MRSEGFYVNEKSTDTSRDRTSDLPICSTGTGHKGRDNERVVGESCCSSSPDMIMTVFWIVTPCTLAHDYQNTQCHIPHDRNIHIYWIEYKVFKLQEETVHVNRAQSVEALRCKSESRGFDPRWYHRNFSST